MRIGGSGAEDTRRTRSCQHDHLSLLRQRVFGLALGYEDLNDHTTLRDDLAIQTALGRVDTLASSSTLCRWENRAERESAVKIHAVIMDQFMASFILPINRGTRPHHGEAASGQPHQIQTDHILGEAVADHLDTGTVQVRPFDSIRSGVVYRPI